MSFKDIELDIIYNTSYDDIVNKLIIPLLKNSKSYYRGVGFFTSNWIKLCLEGINSLVENEGKIYLLTSPELSVEDWHAIEKAESIKAQNIIENLMLKTFLKDQDLYSKESILNYFAWLLADNFIEMKIVICKKENGMYHDKLAIFEDFYGNKVCTHGSMNDSLKATFNGEGISVFKTWGNTKEYVERHQIEFNRLWENKNEYYKVFPVGEFLKKEIIKFKTKERPYNIKRQEKKEIKLPYYVDCLKSYQKDAIESIRKNNWIGLLEMATGTGKTITGISISKEYYETFNRIFLIVLVPYKHLVTQWERNLNDFGYTNIIRCFDSKDKWLNKLNNAVRSFNSGIKTVVCVVATYNSGISEEFIALTGKVSKNSLLLADECHNLGSLQSRKLTYNKFSSKIGLSATPQRWFDDKGTNVISNFFIKTVFEYSLEDAIRNRFLTNYQYFPEIVYLTNEEKENYIEISEKILKIMRIREEDRPKEVLESLLRKRKMIITKAENKIPLFLRIIKEQKLNGEIKNTLVYCAVSENNKITKLLEKIGIRTHQITFKETLQERESILKRFEEGEIEVLVAIKCLDEGVDIPSTQTAYFLASTSNPREFVQRRGRILRTYEGKISAQIYDFIVFPNSSVNGMEDNDIEIDKSIISKEMPRFAEFSAYAINKFQAREKLRKVLLQYNLEYLMDKLPWDIYREIMEDIENG